MPIRSYLKSNGSTGESRHVPSVVIATDAMECPLCLGEGRLKRTEVLDRLGVKDFARVAELSAKEAFRLLQHQHREDEQSVWNRFEAELNRRINEIVEHHRAEVQNLNAEKSCLKAQLKDTERLSAEERALAIRQVRTEFEGKLQTAASRNDDLNRRVEDYLRELTTLRERTQTLQVELSKVARIGKREELDFAQEVRTWPGIYVSEKLPKNGDFIVAFRDASGTPLEPRMLVDNKDKATLGESDIDKLVRDSKERSICLAVLVTRDDEQLRTVDRETRWASKDGIWILRTTRQWLRRDLEILKPTLERMRIEGADFLQKNAALAIEIRRTFVDIDLIEKELKKAAKSIDVAARRTSQHRSRLATLCAHYEATKLGEGDTKAPVC
jgi:hypothetical protein